MLDKILTLYRKRKADFIRIICGTKAECTILKDALETIARCILPDIIKYYEEKRSKEKSESETLTHLTKEAV